MTTSSISSIFIDFNISENKRELRRCSSDIKLKKIQEIARTDLTMPLSPAAISESVQVAMNLTYSHILPGKARLLSKLLSNPIQDLECTMDAILAFAKSLNRKNDNALLVLAEIHKLIKKSFDPIEGGIGRCTEQLTQDLLVMQNNKALKSRFAELVFTKETSVDEFITMVNYLKTQIAKQLPSMKDDQFNYDGLAVSPNKATQTLIQLAAFKGQLLNDVFFETKFQRECREHLRQIFVNGRVFNTNFEKIEAFRNKLRKNLLLSECPIEAKEINKIKESVKAIIAKHHSTLATKLAHQIDNMKFLPSSAVVTGIGVRGRTKPIGKEQKTTANAISIAIRGYKKGTFTNMPNDSVDEIIMQFAEKTLGKANVERFKKELPEVVAHAEPPNLPVLRLGAAIENELCDFIQQPEKLVLEYIQAEIMDTVDVKEKRMLETLLENDFIQALRKAVSDTEIIDHLGKEQIKAGELVKRNTIASIIRKYHHSVICSISGTTTDIVLALEDAKMLLTPLLNHLLALRQSIDTAKIKADATEQERAVAIARAAQAVKFEPTSITEKESYELFKAFFLELTFFMQSGQYHTAAEVLGGLMVAATSLPARRQIPDEDIFRVFEALMANFNLRVSEYFPVLLQDLNVQPLVAAVSKKYFNDAKENNEKRRELHFSGIGAIG